MNILITGTSRGIGLELASQDLQRGDTVVAIARKPTESKELVALKERHSGKLHIAAVDLGQPDAPKKVAEAVSAAKLDAMDVVINNAGIYRKGETLEDFTESFKINSIIPFLVAKQLLPVLKKSKQPKLIQITSLMGSIADNSSGSSHAYRSSKTALNMLTKGLALDEEWLTTAVVHPGWVQTDMGGDEAPTSVQESAAGIWKVIQGLKHEDSGSFYDHEGDSHPW
jgi:NAD(P)-dependent dehydrogenase (short-subunit alcohol dehydrogenase family)